WSSSRRTPSRVTSETIALMAAAMLSRRRRPRPSRLSWSWRSRSASVSRRPGLLLWKVILLSSGLESGEPSVGTVTGPSAAPVFQPAQRRDGGADRTALPALLPQDTNQPCRRRQRLLQPAAQRLGLGQRVERLRLRRAAVALLGAHAVGRGHWG